MAKEFKEWDKKFSASEIEACRKQWLYNGLSQEERNGYTAWAHRVGMWTQKTVHKCVYGHHNGDRDGASSMEEVRDWQLFRVSMKGLNTSEKLYMLANRLTTYSDGLRGVAEQCRIDNYIGALVRGGQLSSDGQYRVIS